MKKNSACQWDDVVRRIQGRLYLGQQQIADRCGVARPTVSAWINGHRIPGLYARRKLVELAAEAGLVVETANGDVNSGPAMRKAPAGQTVQSRQVRALVALVQSLSDEEVTEVTEFARFKIWRRQ